MILIFLFTTHRRGELAEGALRMGDLSTWAAWAQVLTGIAATVVAGFALRVATESDKRSREALKVQTYLQLRSRFIEIYRELGGLEEEETNEVELQLARAAYWHHAWDEWYVTNSLAPREFSDLWTGFFAGAVKSGYCQPGLKASLEKLASKPDEGFGFYATDLIAAVRSMEGKPKSD
ncbi:hypothetical protein LR392_04825 [Arthrobacter sp. AK04]|uniref:hypothetical protein n=1 Tax=Arthrobacter sp. AK04 TaxID=2900048 RepID=UPI001E31E3F6|nr:hypothetical protein [Arthrobacter sp. AK04]MCD5341551.1 hypothetical protein [Arthrobacter sp. AK04]